ncbi:type II secretion system F family protein [Geodermatophilus obscurus]|uniref:Type II secretion system F domain protein n=1 Tax=Geodermatophilus obscurus (strain ATCC 25078 / DSM 43160 / JCM 3152 / CCUG 61914 / KCC A-0152 / KCTC 9177 / NBRC 13315 / NRRL B-3577 / G-20) TaxID=526225 RepID=D2SAY7_GEOOG|nr:type II secretion system F family protein [Geodermatophilus obscurus]ADB76022.1 Type II secretion system F domain protein [Geodermatophilus obscurus DSM 43160]
MLPVAGLLAVTGALLLLALVVLPAGPRRVPLARLDPTVAPPASALAGASAAAGAAVERVLARRGLVARGTAALERAGVAVPLPDVVLLVGLATVVLGALGSLFGGLLLAVVFAAAAPLGTKVLLGLKRGRRQAAFADQLDDSLQLMASSLRAGHSLLRAVDAVSTEAAAPTSEEFARIVNETRVGRDLGDALDEVAERMDSDDFRWVAQAIGIHREVGGNLAEVLDTVGHTIRERNAIRRQVKALSAEGKLSAVVLMALPFGIVGFLSVTNPAYLAGFTEGLAGYLMIAAVVVLLTVGGLWLKKTVAIRF